MNPAIIRPGFLHGVAVGIGVALLAGLVRWSLDPWLGDHLPFAIFFLGIIVAVRYAGIWPALLTMVIGMAFGAVLWFPKGLLATETLSSMALYFFSSLAIIALGQRMHRAEALAAGRLRELQGAVHVLSASQGRLQLATEASGTGVFQWNMREDRFEGENPEAYRIFGREPGQPKLSMNEFIQGHLHPDDVARVQYQLQQSMRPGERFHVEFRNRRANQDWRWVEVVGRFLFDRDATPTDLIGVIADITERRELQDSLRKMAADLSEADRRKDEFLATLAHELRNPLAPIRNGIELLKRSDGNPAHRQGVVGVMERQMSHMVRLVDDLIDVSRITRNKLELRKQEVELAQVLHAAIESSRPLLDAKSHQFTLSLPPAPIYLDADLTRLVQVFTNLLNNAAKYTERCGNLRISAECQGQEAVVSVSDDGSGIPPEMLPKVFDMFTQLDRSVERSQGGLGIGLSMVKRLVELHGGSAAIFSDGLGHGTRVEIRLPTVVAQLSRGPGSVATPGPALRRRILVADDNSDAANSLAEILGILGNQVLTAADGMEAVDQAARFMPDVVMLDIGMPRMNGYEACRRIREQPGNADAVLIAVTGWGQDEDRQRSQQAGFHLHLTKPVDPSALEALLASLPPPRAGG